MPFLTLAMRWPAYSNHMPCCRALVRLLRHSSYQAPFMGTVARPFCCPVSLWIVQMDLPGSEVDPVPFQIEDGTHAAGRADSDGVPAAEHQ